MIVLTLDQWEILKERLSKEYPLSVMSMRYKMREVLGFVPREHTEWLGYYHDASPADRQAHNHGYKKRIHLDFYNEAKETWFYLKYM